jgi:hypothetical protein
MSRNSKNAARIRQAHEVSAMHRNDGKGPAKTKPLHAKKNAWWQKFPSYAAYIRGEKGRGQREALAS